MFSPLLWAETSPYKREIIGARVFLTHVGKKCIHNVAAWRFTFINYFTQKFAVMKVLHKQRNQKGTNERNFTVWSMSMKSIKAE